MPGGVTHDDNAKGSDRYTKHIAQKSHLETGASDGPQVDEIPGQEDLTAEQAMDQVEQKDI